MIFGPAQKAPNKLNRAGGGATAPAFGTDPSSPPFPTDAPVRLTQSKISSVEKCPFSKNSSDAPPPVLTWLT